MAIGNPDFGNLISKALRNLTATPFFGDLANQGINTRGAINNQGSKPSSTIPDLPSFNGFAPTSDRIFDDTDFGSFLANNPEIFNAVRAADGVAGSGGASAGILSNLPSLEDELGFFGNMPSLENELNIDSLFDDEAFGAFLNQELGALPQEESGLDFFGKDGIVAPLLSGIGGLGQLFLGMKGLGAAEDQLDQRRDAFNTNLANQQDAFNIQLADRARARVGSEGAITGPSRYRSADQVIAEDSLRQRGI